MPEPLQPINGKPEVLTYTKSQNHTVGRFTSVEVTNWPIIRASLSLLESKNKGWVIPIFYQMSFKMEIKTFALYEILQCVCPNGAPDLGRHLLTQFQLKTAGA